MAFSPYISQFSFLIRTPVIGLGPTLIQYDLILTNYIFLLLFSHEVVSNSLRPHGLQHARLPYPSVSPRICSNSCPLSWWCLPTISSSVTPFSFISAKSLFQVKSHSVVPGEHESLEDPIQFRALTLSLMRMQKMWNPPTFIESENTWYAISQSPCQAHSRVWAGLCQWTPPTKDFVSGAGVLS